MLAKEWRVAESDDNIRETKIIGALHILKKYKIY
jgi:hypothetical protein